jgi:hypothetical protein
MNLTASGLGGGIGALRRFAKPPVADEPVERCELCGTAIGEAHDHLHDPGSRRLLCSCGACALLFDTPGARFVRVPRDVRRLASPIFTDEAWEALSMPIGLAFFFYSTPLERIAAMYPSPAGATESLLPLGIWDRLVPDGSPARELVPDVQALLVNRVAGSRRRAEPVEYIVPIDACYALVGIIRSEWRGFSGGESAWNAIDRFFERLDGRAYIREQPRA